MKHTSLLAIALSSFLFSCQSRIDPAVENPKIEKTIQQLFNTISEFDYDGIRARCTSEFSIFDMGLDLDLDGFIELIQGFEGKGSISYKLENFKIKISDDVSWVTLTNHTSAKMGDQEIEYNWLESAVLVKNDDVWKIDFYHSTEIKKQDEDMSTE
jgi:hypothetical protein